jgi:NAD(P) transhydrogenase
MSVEKYDVIVIGSGPSGQKAAVHAAKAGHRTAIIERDPVIGGSCVHRGTIPSKTLRENALRVKEMRRNATFANFQLAEETELAVLLKRLKKVLMAHDEYMQRQIKRENVEFIHGRAKFMDPHTLEVVRIRREPLTIQAKKIVIATGSFPRNPPSMPVDHEHVLDSDSILSLLYLPQSLTVLGGGVIASEYASIFQALGVKVTMIDKYPLPLGFLDDDLTKSFVDAFENMGGTWIGNASVEEVYWDGVDQVVSVLKSGEEFRSNKLLSAAGRVANVDDLQIQNAGLSLNDQQLISVNDRLQTDVEHIYAAGDVIGPPSLASSSMEQGRRAISNAIGSPVEDMSELIPSGIYLARS